MQQPPQRRSSAPGWPRIGSPNLKAMLEDLRCDRDAWRDQVQRLALPNTADAKPVSLWRWLRTTK
jgi:hypothetical protein